jgi:hypothetical protein
MLINGFPIMLSLYAILGKNDARLVTQAIHRRIWRRIVTALKLHSIFRVSFARAWKC